MRQHKEILTTEDMKKRHLLEGGFDMVDKRILKFKEHATALIDGTFRDALRLGVVLNEIEGAVLEVGCSSGAFTYYFSMFNHDVTAIDFVEEQLIKAKNYNKNNKAKFFLMDAHKLDFENESFDTVFLGEIIEHVLEPETVIKEALRVLKKGGKLIITIPDHFGEYIDGVSTTVHINQPTDKDIIEITPIELKKLKCIRHHILVGRK